MSDDLYGSEATEAAHGFSPMAEPTQQRDDEDKTYSSDTEGLREAASDLRESTPPTLIERKYVKAGGEHAGEESDPNETIKFTRGVRDLTETRSADGAEAEAQL